MENLKNTNLHMYLVLIMSYLINVTEQRKYEKEGFNKIFP